MTGTHLSILGSGRKSTSHSGLPTCYSPRFWKVVMALRKPSNSCGNIRAVVWQLRFFMIFDDLCSPKNTIVISCWWFQPIMKFLWFNIILLSTNTIPTRESWLICSHYLPMISLGWCSNPPITGGLPPSPGLRPVAPHPPRPAVGRPRWGRPAGARRRPSWRWPAGDGIFFLDLMGILMFFLFLFFRDFLIIQ